ncbi:serine protease [Flavobacterium sp. PL02]|uniref:S1 family peptidase n=1 Tax=Flavobacterium sp. PL02 TaxID=3088354 RepID=UPI002B227898|nr:serine protease [Flavobacterium sp. PL02]MEA9414343.1 serine protease [Flavobacterium sp. PL02]
MLIHPEQLVDNVSRISCGDEQGTGFFISPTRLLTARHVIVDHLTDAYEIAIQFPDKNQEGFTEFLAKLIDEDENLDIAIIEIAGERTNKTCLPVLLDYIRYNEEWVTFGYPFAKLAEGQHISGTVLALIRNLPYDLSLVSADIETCLDYNGLSGSPLIMSGRVTGIITWSTIRGLGAISIKKIIKFLTKNNVEFEDMIDASWSNDFLAEMDRAVANEEVIKTLQSAVSSAGHYYLLHGSPGSGKSIIASTIKLEDPKIKVIGRYLIRTPGDPIPIYVKATRENFMQWMEDLISKTLTGEPIAKEMLGWNERVARLSNWLGQFNDYYSAKNEFAVIVVDGLDELLINGNNTIGDFLSVLPEKLPTNLTVILSCTTIEILPVSIASKLTEEQKIYVTPLSQSQTVRFIQQENKRIDLGLTLIQETFLTQKSEGHPLYLRYLIETLKINLPTDRDEWITALPVIGGDIKNYYESLWSSQIMSDTDKYWMALIGSQLRESVTTNEFKGMLPEATRYHFQRKFANIRHLFKTGGKVSIYHNSFENFIEQKGLADIKDAHKYISDFNLSTNESVYALKNRLHHLLHSPNPVPAMAYCNQKWADDCALVHMEPDRIIDDILRVEALCIDQASAADLIRIKLLLQRLRFRYNNVLAKHAYEITDALIQMGNSEDALKYILRGNLLLVSLDDAVYFLQKLYETGACKEASLINDAIDIRFKAMIEKAHQGQEIDLQGFVYNLQAITLRCNIEPINSVMLKFMNGMQILKDLEDYPDTPAKDRQYIHELRDYISTWYLGYIIYRFNRYPGIEKMAEISDEIYNNSSAKYLAEAAIHYYHLKEIGIQGSEDNSAYLHLTDDIEELITNYGYRDQDSEFLIKTLIEESKNPTLIEGIINKQLTNRVEFNFRNINGVDADFDSFIKLFNERTYDGYIDQLNAFPILRSRSANSWELFFKSAFELAGFITGKVYRLKAEGLPESIVTLEQKSRDLVLQLNFTLLDRTKFERSYQLIEKIMPILYHRLISLYLEFKPLTQSWFIGHIIKACENQLGQYTEGYRKSMAEMAEKLAQYPSQKQNAFKLIEILEQHVYVAVQNRWERTPELIHIVNLYSKLGSKSKAKYVYQEMLDTSMGPSWYKEGQLALINSVLRKMNVPNAHKHFVDFAACLEFASGEMTFQRYVQSEIHGFIGTLTKAGYLSKAIEYFKFQLLPDPIVILANAESSLIDAPIKGDGYVLGARTIIEPSAILELLETTTSNSMLIIALSEVFLISSDTERYLKGFTEIQYKVYQDAKSTSREDCEHILHRLTSIILSPRLEGEKSSYIYKLSEAFGEEFEHLERKLLEAGLSPDILPEKKQPKLEKKSPKYTEEEDEKMAKYGLPFPGVGKMSNFPKITIAIQAAEQEFAIENDEGGRQLLIDCLKMLHADESDIWQGRYLTSELGLLFNLLKDHSSSKELILLFKDLILEHLTEDWHVASFLLGLLDNKLPDDEKEKIILIVKEHIEILIRSNGIFKEKYEWLADGNGQIENEDIQLTKFLVWLLNHPYASVQKVVLNALQWLGTVQPSLVIPILIEYSLIGKIERASEMSAYLLKNLSKTHAIYIWNNLVYKKSFQDDIFKVGHIMIRIYWRDVLAACRSQDAYAEALYKRFSDEFPVGKIIGSDVYLDDVSLQPIENLIDELNSMEVLNRTFCENLMDNISELSEPLSIVDQLRVERYIRRSFYEENINMGHYTYLLRIAINKTLIGRVGDLQIDEISTILKL